jgi:hypothetical protein
MEDLMRTLLKPLLSLCLLILIVSGVLLIPSPGGSAWAQACGLTVFKAAEGSGSLEFSFTGFIDGVEVLTADPQAGEQFTHNFFLVETYLVVENPTPGWVLDNIICEGEGVAFNFDTENAVQVACLTGLGSGSCTFINVRDSSPREIPTLSEWGMIAAAAGLMMVGVFFAVRKRRITA